MNKNRTVLLRSRPQGKAAASDFEIALLPIPTPAEGQILLRNHYLSIDPGVRNLLGAEKGYLPPIAVGSAVTGTVLGEVLVSRHPSFSPGDLALGRGALGEYSLVTPDTLCWKIAPDRYPSLSSVISVLGIPGLTAYFGLIEVAKPSPGETVLVSGAAGGVGSLAGQIAKICGCHVIGIAGGDDKCRLLLDEFGFDAAVDHQGKDVAALSAAINAAAPGGVDIFFDNVGGKVLDAALAQMNRTGRIAACGMISQYDGGSPPQMTNLFHIIAKALHVQGFLLFQFADRYQQAFEALAQWVADGRLRYREDIAEGIEAAVPSFLTLFAGTNKGKTMIRLR